MVNAPTRPINRTFVHMKLLTRNETAKLLRVDPKTVLRMLARGDLQGFSVGRITRVKTESVERLIGCPVDQTDLQAGALK